MSAPTVEEQKELVLKALADPKSNGMIYFDNKVVVGFWYDCLKQLEDAGEIKMDIREIDEQYSRLEIRKA